MTATATTTATATATYADYFQGQQVTRSYTGTEAQAATWLAQQKLNLGADLLASTFGPTAPAHVETDRERLVRVMREITAEEDAEDLNRVLAGLKPINRRSPRPLHA